MLPSKIRPTTSLSRLTTGLPGLYGRQEQRDERRDNHNDNQELDQCEAASGRESRAETTDEAGSDHDNLLVVRSLCEAQREREESSARSVRVSCRSINRLARKAKSDVQSRRPYPTCRGFIIASTPRPGRTLRDTDNGQVFWLPDQPTSHAFPRVSVPAVADVAFVPGYSGGTATDLHRFPSSSDLDLVSRSAPMSHPIVPGQTRSSSHSKFFKSTQGRGHILRARLSSGRYVSARYAKILGSTVRLERRKPIAAETGPLLDQSPGRGLESEVHGEKN